MQIGATQTITNALVGGARQQVTASWLVPSAPNAHSVFVVVDPGLSLDDRDRSNNVASMKTVLPDLAIATCWSSEVSASQVALVARVFNSGAMYSEPCEIAWRLGAVDGEEIGRSGLDVLMPGQTNEIAYVWDTSGRQFSNSFVTVFTVVDVAGVVPELDKSNNTYAQTVQVIPSWVPRLTSVNLVSAGTVTLTFEAGNYPASSFAVESTGSLASQIQWTVEASAAITNTAPGIFEAQVPVQGSQRFYRIRATQ